MNQTDKSRGKNEIEQIYVFHVGHADRILDLFGDGADRCF